MMKLAFSTLGCPDWNLAQIVEAAQRFRYDGVELRAIGGSLDLLNRPEFRPAEIANTRRHFQDHAVSICCVDTSCTFHFLDRRERLAQVDLALAHAELAAQLGATLVRVFPDRIQPGATSEQTRDFIAESLREIAERLPAGLHIALETHGDFARTEAAAEIATLVDHPGVKLIWDVANSVAAGDSVKHGARIVEPYLAHIHLRDARPVARSEHWLPVLAGRGCVPFAEAVAAIETLKFDGYVSFEWEKYWHPAIEEPEVALPDFISAIRKLQSDTTKSSGVGK
jgi:sugar phosphate isomerase/epimerase